MNKKPLILSAIGIFMTALLMWPKKAMSASESAALMFGDVIPGNPRRGCDGSGCGAYQASRGSREHKGIDIAADVGDKVYSPISGTVLRQTQVYSNDTRYRGIVIAGTGIYVGYEVKLFYLYNMIMQAGVEVTKNQVIGQVQDLRVKYPSIKNHVHVEIRKDGVLIDPTNFIK